MAGFGQFRHIFPEPHFHRSLINPPCQLLVFPRGMGPYIIIAVVYSLEKTIGAPFGVSSTLFSSNLKKNHLFCSILANYPNSLLSKTIKYRPIFHFLLTTSIEYLNEIRLKVKITVQSMNNINLSSS